MKFPYPLHYLLLSRLNHGNLPHSLAFNRITRRLFIEKMRRSLLDRRLIFAISSGRSGSGYLANLLSLCPDVFACHEPRPRMNGRYLRMVMDQGLSRTYDARLLKLFGISLSLSRLPEGIVYAETSHMFIKTYFDIIIDYFDKLEVIVLRRPLGKILRSFAQLDYFSPNSFHWQDWMYIPVPYSSFSEPIAGSSEMDKYDRCIAYLLDIEARAQSFIESNNAKVGIHEVHLEEISSDKGAKDLVSSLGLTYPQKGIDLSALKKNQALDAKNYHNSAVTLSYCRDRVGEYLLTATKMGIALPDLSKVRI